MQECKGVDVVGLLRIIISLADGRWMRLGL